MLPESVAFDALSAKMESLKVQMLNELNRELFADAGGSYPKPKPRPWYVQWGWVIRGYISTLWRALKGEDPYEAWDDY